MANISNARLFDEFCKIFLYGYAEKNFNKLSIFGLNKYLLLTDINHNQFSDKLIQESLKNTDKRYLNNQSVTPGFLIAALLWPIVIESCKSNNQINLRKLLLV